MAPHNNAPSTSFGRFPQQDSHPSTQPESGFQVSAAIGMDDVLPMSSTSGSSMAGADGHTETIGGQDYGTRTEPLRRLVPGVYVPTVCFFDLETEDVDTATIARHAVRLARSGVAGLTTQGSNGEAVHLAAAERRLVTRTTRTALDAAGFGHMPLIVGCGSQSTRETIAHCREAWAAGGDAALVLPPAYYSSMFLPNAETVVTFYERVADASPIPLVLYNFPAAVGGLDLSSDVIARLAAHPNIVGVKLTCGNTGKLARVVAATRGLDSSKTTTITGAVGAPGTADMGTVGAVSPPPFLVLGGSADFTLQTLVVGGHGILAGLANLAPKACVRTITLFQQGNLVEAQKLQALLARGDWTAIQGGLVGVKAGLQAWSGYGGCARSPLPRPTAQQMQAWKEGFRELVLLEKSL